MEFDYEFTNWIGKSRQRKARASAYKRTLQEKLLLKSWDEYAKKVSEAYQASPSFEAEYKSSWNSLIRHIEKMFEQMKSRIKIEFVDEDPYSSEKEVSKDIKENARLKVYTGFSDHPIWSKEQNLKFRAYHDYMSHVAGSHSFGLKGEIAAYNQHLKMAPKDALVALFTEVVGQVCTKIVTGSFPEQKITKLHGFDYVNLGQIDEEEYKNNFQVSESVKAGSERRSPIEKQSLVTICNHSVMSESPSMAKGAIKEGAWTSYVKLKKEGTRGQGNGSSRPSIRKSINENTLISLDTKLFWRLAGNTTLPSLFSRQVRVLEATRQADSDVLSYKFWLEDRDKQFTVRIAITSGGLTSVPEDAHLNPEKYIIIDLPVEDGLNESVRFSQISESVDQWGLPAVLEEGVLPSGHYFHGSSFKFQGFEKPRGGNNYGIGIYLTKDPEEAIQYSLRADGSGWLYEVEPRISKVFDVHSKADADKIRREMERRGFRFVAARQYDFEKPEIWGDEPYDHQNWYWRLASMLGGGHLAHEELGKEIFTWFDAISDFKRKWLVVMDPKKLKILKTEEIVIGDYEFTGPTGQKKFKKKAYESVDQWRMPLVSKDLTHNQPTEPNDNKLMHSGTNSAITGNVWTSGSFSKKHSKHSMYPRRHCSLTELHESRFQKTDLKSKRLLLPYLDRSQLQQIPIQTRKLFESWLERQSNQEIEPVADIEKIDGVSGIVVRLRVDDSPWRLELDAWDLVESGRILLVFRKTLNKEVSQYSKSILAETYTGDEYVVGAEIDEAKCTKDDMRGITTKKLKDLSATDYYNADTGLELDPEEAKAELYKRYTDQQDKLISAYKRKPKKNTSAGEPLGESVVSDEYEDILARLYPEEFVRELKMSDLQAAVFLGGRIKHEQHGDLIVRYVDGPEKLGILGLLSRNDRLKISDASALKSWLGRLRTALDDGKQVFVSLNDKSEPLFMRALAGGDFQVEVLSRHHFDFGNWKTLLVSRYFVAESNGAFSEMTDQFGIPEVQLEQEYQGRQVTLNKPFRTPDGPKKFSVYTKNEKGNVVKVNFGDPNMEIKRDDPERRKSFRARHHCDSPGPKWKARYWSCQATWHPTKKVSDVVESINFNSSQLVWMDPNKLEFYEFDQDPKKVSSYTKQLSKLPPIVAAGTVSAAKILDGHHRALAAIERHENIRTILLPWAFYDSIKSDDYTDKDIADAAVAFWADNPKVSDVVEASQSQLVNKFNELKSKFTKRIHDHAFKAVGLSDDIPEYFELHSVPIVLKKMRGLVAGSFNGRQIVIDSDSSTQDQIETLFHEMIHVAVFQWFGNEHDAHGPFFEAIHEKLIGPMPDSWKSEMTEGARGDWQKEGYHISHVIRGDRIVVTTKDQDENKVGQLTLVDKGEYIKNAPAHIVYVHEPHQRKGIASAMYQYAERITGKKAKQGMTTPAGEKLWSQPNRPFGESKKEPSIKSLSESLDQWGMPFFEAKQVGTLYHLTSSKGLMGIVADKFKLDSNINGRYDRDEEACVSFTRSKSFKFMPGTYYPSKALYKESNPAARIVIDGDKLSNRYPVQPYNDRPQYGARFRKSKDIFSDSESEERICGHRTVDILSSVIKVEVRKRFEEKLHDEIEQMRQLGITVEIVDKVW